MSLPHIEGRVNEIVFSGMPTELLLKILYPEHKTLNPHWPFPKKTHLILSYLPYSTDVRGSVMALYEFRRRMELDYKVISARPVYSEQKSQLEQIEISSELIDTWLVGFEAAQAIYATLLQDFGCNWAVFATLSEDELFNDQLMTNRFYDHISILKKQLEVLKKQLRQKRGRQVVGDLAEQVDNLEKAIANYSAVVELLTHHSNGFLSGAKLFSSGELVELA
jgi:hypothetical protein